MGIRGTVRRSVDGDFIHSNIDIDLLIDEEQEVGNDQKPKELFDIVERFCLGKRRLVSVSYFSNFGEKRSSISLFKNRTFTFFSTYLVAIRAYGPVG